jgi:hypothetical protein
VPLVPTDDGTLPVGVDPVAGAPGDAAPPAIAEFEPPGDAAVPGAGFVPAAPDPATLPDGDDAVAFEPVVPEVAPVGVEPFAPAAPLFVPVDRPTVLVLPLATAPALVPVPVPVAPLGSTLPAVGIEPVAAAPVTGTHGIVEGTFVGVVAGCVPGCADVPGPLPGGTVAGCVPGCVAGCVCAGVCPGVAAVPAGAGF